MKRILILLVVLTLAPACYAKEKVSTNIVPVGKKLYLYSYTGKQEGYLKNTGNKIKVYDVYGNSKGYYRSTTGNNNNYRFYNY